MLFELGLTNFKPFASEQRAKLADIEETSHVRIYVRPDIDAPFEQTSISSKSSRQSPKQSPGKPRRGGS